jgi:hypothetical protein
MVHEPLPCVVVNADGVVDKKQLQAVKKYWRTIARAKQKLGFAERDVATLRLRSRSQRGPDGIAERHKGSLAPGGVGLCHTRRSSRTPSSNPVSAASCLSGGATCEVDKRNSARHGDAAVNSTFGNRGDALT